MTAESRGSFRPGLAQGLSLLIGAAALSSLASAAPVPNAQPAAPQPVAAGPARDPSPAIGGTIGLVITNTRVAFHETADGKEECGNGLQQGALQQWKATDYMAMQKKFGGNFANRGPNNELDTQVPLAVVDPLPWVDVTTNKSFGVNLDGTQDGRATARTCKHEKFVSPEGAQVDNQLARVLGCVQGWRNTGFNKDFISKEMETEPEARLLIEITGVNDVKNDPSVDVTMYKGRDRIVRTTSGKAWVPNMSHRVDTRFPELTTRMKGRIVDGVLITDPAPLARMNVQQIDIVGERRMRNMVLRLKLEGDDATGTMNGYEPIDTWWAMLRSHPGSDTGRYSPAAVYRAALRFADGYPDPKTKQCSAISASYAVTATRALIAHEGTPRTIALGQK